ncbi:MAG: DegT/DnrJ/EryC1/StrS family aminotransferase [Planctomycetota bacterium]|jgi:dTDP-4-amino-4,6-dideoxygalactose transaminase|nr:MAG: DegT/DnrJ/EryC1/StrS family aminotransferase [Planctomycetota bacterium]
MTSTSPAWLDSVPLLALDRQYDRLRLQIREALERVCDSGRFILGPDVSELESELAEMLKVPHVISCASGSDALLLALMALDIGPGDEVVIPSYTFFATASAVTRLGAIPIFADIDPVTYLIDPDDVERRISSKCRAIVPVHLYGRTANMEALGAIAKQAQLPIIEDAAQSILSSFENRCSGSLGDIGCFSFYPTKNLGGIGDGGFLTTTRDDLARSLRLLRVHGMEPRYHHTLIGINSRLDSIQAAVLRVKLPYLNDWTTARQVNAERYAKLFSDYPLESHIVIPTDDPRGRHVWNQFVIRVKGGCRDALRSHLTNHRVGTEIYYPVPLHMQKCFEYLRWTKGDLPETERASEETLALPIFPELETFEQETVVGRIAEFFGVSKRTPHEAKTPAATVRERDSNTSCILQGRMPHVLSRTRSAGKADDVRS